jgi:hypothetical protein
MSDFHDGLIADNGQKYNKNTLSRNFKLLGDPWKVLQGVRKSFHKDISAIINFNFIEIKYKR